MPWFGKAQQMWSACFQHLQCRKCVTETVQRFVAVAGFFHPGSVKVGGHVALELDWLPDRFFDAAGQYLVCTAHGALFLPDTGACIGGPGRGPLVKIPLLERDGVVYWQSGQDFVPAAT